MANADGDKKAPPWRQRRAETGAAQSRSEMLEPSASATTIVLPSPQVKPKPTPPQRNKNSNDPRAALTSSSPASNIPSPSSNLPPASTPPPMSHNDKIPTSAAQHAMTLRPSPHRRPQTVHNPHRTLPHGVSAPTSNDAPTPQDQNQEKQESLQQDFSASPTNPRRDTGNGIPAKVRTASGSISFSPSGGKAFRSGNNTDLSPQASAAQPVRLMQRLPSISDIQPQQEGEDGWTAPRQTGEGVRKGSIDPFSLTLSLHELTPAHTTSFSQPTQCRWYPQPT